MWSLWVKIKQFWSKVPSLGRSVAKPLKVPSLALSVPKPLRVPSLARSVPKLLLIVSECRPPSPGVKERSDRLSLVLRDVLRDRLCNRLRDRLRDGLHEGLCDRLWNFWYFIFLESYICYTKLFDLNCDIRKKVQKNFLMGLKIRWSWGSGKKFKITTGRLDFIFSCRTSGFDLVFTYFE